MLCFVLNFTQCLYKAARKMASPAFYKKECITQRVIAETQLLMASLSKCKWPKCKSSKMTWPSSLFAHRVKLWINAWWKDEYHSHLGSSPIALLKWIHEAEFSTEK